MVINPVFLPFTRFSVQFTHCTHKNSLGIVYFAVEKTKPVKYLKPKTHINKTKILSYSLPVLTVIAVFGQDIMWMRSAAEYEFQVLLAFFFGGLLFLTINQNALVYSCFLSASILALHLKDASNPNLNFPSPNKSVPVQVALFNMSNVNEYYTDMLDLIDEQDPDIISFQELTPDWDQRLIQDLSDIYPYRYNYVRIDPYGLGLFSKLPFELIDTFHCQNIPHFTGTVRVDGTLIQIFSAYLTPALDRRSTDIATHQLDYIIKYIHGSSLPVLAVGDFNMVHWTPEMLQFKNKTDLLNSRKELSANPVEIPYEHIFHSNGLECTTFGSLRTIQNVVLGVAGTYQHKQAGISEQEVKMSTYTQ